MVWKSKLHSVEPDGGGVGGKAYMGGGESNQNYLHRKALFILKVV